MIIHFSRSVFRLGAPCPLASAGFVIFPYLVRIELYQVDSCRPVKGGSRVAPFSAKILSIFCLSAWSGSALSYMHWASCSSQSPSILSTGSGRKRQVFLLPAGVAFSIALFLGSVVAGTGGGVGERGVGTSSLSISSMDSTSSSVSGALDVAPESAVGIMPLIPSSGKIMWGLSSTSSWSLALEWVGGGVADVSWG